MTDENRYRIGYVLTDYAFVNLAWLTFIISRFFITKVNPEMQGIDSVFTYLHYTNVVQGQIIFPIFTLFIFYLSGYYNTVFSKSRLSEFLTTITSCLVATIFIYFIILVNDSVHERAQNYILVLALWGSLFAFAYTPRLLITGHIRKQIACGKIFFNTLILGDKPAIDKVVESIETSCRFCGYRIVGTAKYDESQFDDIERFCCEKRIQTIIIAPRSTNSNEDTLKMINKLLRLNVPIKLAPEIYDIITSNIRHANIIDEPFVNIVQSSMPEWQKSTKRMLDLAISAIALVALIPLFIIIALLIKIDSKGPVFYSQKRIGKGGRLFSIYKFRSMRNDAEASGIPQLTKLEDNRITGIGHFLRKFRIDETPQFWNVIKGDMSLVGPRPEREYYASKIIEQAPYYTLLYQVRPGITSWGMVKFGYAKNVEEMIERSKYDLIYLENMSLFIDLKIIIYTVRTVLTGKGL